MKRDHRSEMIYFTYNVVAAGCKFKKEKMVLGKALLFFRHLGFSHAVLSLFALAVMAEIHVSRVWMTPLIKTIPDYYSYFLAVTSSRDVDVCTLYTHVTPEVPVNTN